MTEDEKRIEQEAIKFAKKNRTAIANELTNRKRFPPEDEPVAVFMAGSPGAGKTETSREFLQEVEATNVIRLDPDELRHYFEQYTGDNSFLFQRAVSSIVERTLDNAFKRKQSFLLDGTLSNYAIAEKNIKRAIDRGRAVLVLFVYQSPELAWKFVQSRERVEGRRINPEIFVEQFLESQAVVRKLKQQFGGQIKIDLLLKDNEGGTRMYHANIQAVENHVKHKFTRETLTTLIQSIRSLIGQPNGRIMMFARLKNGQTTKYNSSLSEFVRNADSSKKKKVYSRVIDRAVESQNSVVKQAELLQTR